MKTIDKGSSLSTTHGRGGSVSQGTVKESIKASLWAEFVLESPGVFVIQDFLVLA